MNEVKHFDPSENNVPLNFGDLRVEDDPVLRFP
jgi:hypothetical protein